MAPDPSSPITALLHQAAAGDRAAEDELLRTLYAELHQLARRQMRQERREHTLQPTALVNEAYVRLLRGRDADFRDRAHFFAVASTVMRRILVDHARRRSASKRGDGVEPIELRDDDGVALSHRPEIVLAVDRALSELATLHPRQARVVELRFFAGMTEEEIGALLEISSRTVKREWTAAKAWLYQHLEG
jgi:RNA polymerase sigma factor (TIGR02999 family)